MIKAFLLTGSFITVDKISGMRFNMYTYILYSWLLALALHPFVFMIVRVGRIGSELNVWDIVSFIAGFFWAGLVFSLPALLLSAVLLWAILFFTRMSSIVALLLWYLVVALCIFSFPGLLLMLFLTPVEVLSFITPALIAAGLSLLLRHRQFNKIFMSFERARNFRLHKRASI